MKTVLPFETESMENNDLLVVVKALCPLKIKANNLPEINLNTMQSSHPLVWCGGDLAEVAETTVESVNDGKTAAWFIHCALEVNSLIVINK